MNWQIFYTTGKDRIFPFEKWLNSLSNSALKSVAKEIELLRLAGNQLKLPHSRSLGSGLFELREREHGFRIYYTFQGQKSIILLLAGNKDTQEKDIHSARKKLTSLKKPIGEYYEIKEL